MTDLSVDAYNTRIRAAVPIAAHLGILAEALESGVAVLVMPYGDHLSRPGQVVSGPALMSLADIAMGAAVLTVFGPEMTVFTADLNIHFLRKGVRCAVRAVATVLKTGKTLSMTEARLVNAATDELVAHATASFAVQPRS